LSLFHSSIHAVDGFLLRPLNGLRDGQAREQTFSHRLRRDVGVGDVFELEQFAEPGQAAENVLHLLLGQALVAEEADDGLRGGVCRGLDLSHHFIAAQPLLNARAERLRENLPEERLEEVNYLIVNGRWHGFCA
jgi:hypothetical protein